MAFSDAARRISLVRPANAGRDRDAAGRFAKIQNDTATPRRIGGKLPRNRLKTRLKFVRIC